MKYFRFVCEIKAKSSEDVNKSRDCINEVGIYCAYLLENIKSLDPLLYSHLTHQKYIRIK